MEENSGHKRTAYTTEATPLCICERYVELISMNVIYLIEYNS